MEQIVLGLLHHRLVQVMALGNFVGGADFIGIPLRGTPVERLAARDDVAHRPYGFLDRRGRVGTVAIHQVDVIELQTLQRAVDRIHQIFAVQRMVLIGAAVDAPEELGRYHIADARPAQLLQRGAHDGLGLPAGIHLCVVEEIDAGIVRNRKRLACRMAIDLIAVGDPGTQGQLTDLQA